MKCMQLLMAIILLFGCRSTKFSYLSDTDIENYGQLKTFNTGAGYNLYVRQVIKKFDINSNTYKPVNSPRFQKDSVIEVEYLLRSEKDSQVIVFNNIPSIYQTLVSEENKRFLQADQATVVEIDIWYFRQFRFGKIDMTGRLVFSHAGGTTNEHAWTLRGTPDSINVSSISIADKYGEDTRYTKEAFALGVVFRRVDDFKMLFNYKKRGKIISTHNLKDQTFYVSGTDKKYRILFKFDDSINETDKKNIGFTKDRMYAEPVD